jgi:hypothetical protein
LNIEHAWPVRTGTDHARQTIAMQTIRGEAPQAN